MLKSFVEFWIAEIVDSLGTEFAVVVQNSAYEFIPQFAPRRVLERVPQGCKRFALVTVCGKICVEVSHKDYGLYGATPIVAFSPKGTALSENEISYVKHLHSRLFSEFLFVKSLEESSVHFCSPNVGQICKTHEDAKTLLIGVPIHKRFKLTQVFCKYTFEYLIPMLKWQGFEVFVCFVGSESDLENIEAYSQRSDFVFVRHSNDLGEKKNSIVEVAKTSQTDYLLWIDSDDFFPPSLCLKLLEKAELNGYWASVERFGFYDTLQGQYLRFGGYPAGHQLFQEGMGSGRVFTKKLLNEFEVSFARGNKSMDSSVKSVLSKLNLIVSERLVIASEESKLAIGVKTSQNIWGASTYSTEKLSSAHTLVSWLPFEIKSLIENLHFEDS